MSSQTIISKKYYDHLDDIDDFYMSEGNKYLYEMNYDINEKLDIEKFIFVNWIDEIISTGECEDLDILKENLNLILE